MSKFKIHQEQKYIIGSDYNLASEIKEKQVVVGEYDRHHDSVELKKVTNILENLKIKYWIDYGTLLGAYRKNKVIKHDNDLDICILPNNIDSEFLCESLSSDYYIMHHSPNEYICIYPKNNPLFSMVHIDLYFSIERDKYIQSVPWINIFTPKLFLDELDSILLEGVSFKCPRHLETYLKIRFGEDFMIEKPNFHPDKNILNFKEQYTAYTCGVFDMFHIGHLNLFKRIKDSFDKLIVGVHNDEDVITYKKKPTIPYQERLEIVKSCRYVDEVYENAELIVTDNFLDEFKSDYLVVGRENEEFLNRFYKISKNRLHLIERTKDISSSIIKSSLKL